MEEMDYKAVGERVKLLRNRAGLTQEEMAEKCTISTSYLGHIERGTRKPSLGTIYKVAQSLEVSIDALVGAGVNDAPNITAGVKALLENESPQQQVKFNNIVKILAENIDRL